MSSWNGYLSDGTRNTIVEVLIDAGLSNHASTLAMLNGLSNRFMAQLPPPQGLPDSLRLANDIAYINKISKLTTGEVPIEIFLSNIRRHVQDVQHIDSVNDALLEIEENPPSSHSDTAIRQKLNKTLSHSKFEAFANAVTKRKAISATAADLTMADGLESLSSDPTPTIHRELTILRDEKLPINFALGATQVAKSVFKLVVHRHFGGNPNMLGTQNDTATGTAWVIGRGIGITNYHVFEARDQFESDASQQDFTLQVNTTRLIPDYFDASVNQTGSMLGDGALIASNRELDYAIFSLPNEVKDRAPLSLVSTPLLKNPDQPVRARVNVVQHPHGLPMQLAIRNNYIMSGDEQQLTYLSDTESGSSGSPVMNDNWQVGALHIGGRENQALNFELLGRPINHENIGVAMAAILNDINSQKPETFQQITQA